MSQNEHTFDYEFLKVDSRGAYCVLTLNRPDMRNALSKQMRDEFLDFLSRCEGAFPVIVLTGEGSAFCSGLDLKERPGEAGSREMWAIGRGIYNSGSVFVAAVNGAARGGGLTLVNACDLAVASPKATFGIPEIGFGVYATVAAPTVQFAGAKKLTAKMVLTGQAIRAEEAARGYLINEVVPEDALISEAAKVADHLASLSPGALAIAKQGINQYPFDDASRDGAVELSLSLNAKNMGEAWY